jgi:hypothetical protein
MGMGIEILIRWSVSQRLFWSLIWMALTISRGSNREFLESNLHHVGKSMRWTCEYCKWKIWKCHMISWKARKNGVWKCDDLNLERVFRDLFSCEQKCMVASQNLNLWVWCNSWHICWMDHFMIVDRRRSGYSINLSSSSGRLMPEITRTSTIEYGILGIVWCSAMIFRGNMIWNSIPPSSTIRETRDDFSIVYTFVVSN